MPFALAANGSVSREREESVLPSPVLGMLFLLFSETMFFAGLISAYWVLRSGFEIWPPPGQPRLPVVVTAVNTCFLLSSGAAMFVFRRRPEGGAFWLRLAVGLGALFLMVQGYEWVRLMGFGLTANSGLFGATFYLLIGAHALHVLAGVALLAWLGAKAPRVGVQRVARQSVDLVAMYWTFVVVLWPVLYALVYF